MIERAKQLIEERVRTWDNVSFMEIERLLKEENIVKNNPEKGYYYELKSKLPNIIFWSSKNEYVIESAKQLLDEKKIFFYPTTWLVYGADGGGMGLPTVSGKKMKYKTPHWCPVVFCSYPEEEWRRRNNAGKRKTKK